MLEEFKHKFEYDSYVIKDESFDEAHDLDETKSVNSDKSEHIVNSHKLLKRNEIINTKLKEDHIKYTNSHNKNPINIEAIHLQIMGLAVLKILSLMMESFVLLMKISINLIQKEVMFKMIKWIVGM
jgi:hypothetical protein